MHFLFLILLVALIPSAAVAAAEQITVGTHDVLRGRFTEEKHLNGFTKPMRSEGHFVVAPQQGLIWGMEKPFPTTTVITPAGLVQSINGISVMRLPAQKIPFMRHLYDTLGGALTGNWAALETDFTVTRSGDEQAWQVTLVPRHTDNPAMPFSSINVSGHRFVENVEMLKADGDSDTLTFLDSTVSSAPPTEAENRAFTSVRP